MPPEERALWEAAIQLDLVTVNTAEEQVAQGRTVTSWMAAQEPGEIDHREHPRSLDRPVMLAVVAFNFLVLIALAAAIAWGFRLLF